MTQNHITKPHYEILDGLRGVAAVMVVAFHIFEAYATPSVETTNSKFDQILNHAYLAVDFFFMLSGYVIGYAYDDRWGKMSIGNFLKRRIFRLHPMVIFGSLLGVLMFYFGASTLFPIIRDVPVWKLLVYALLGILMIPTTPKMDIRGWQEMYTMNGPLWSLFFEYIANILYALFIRRFSKTALCVLVTVAAGATCYLTLTQGDVIGGWTLNGHHMQVGFTRLMFPFFAGLLLFRIGKKIHIHRAFLWSSLLLVVLLSAPRIGGEETVWMNGLYEAALIMMVFPLIVLMGAGGEVTGKRAAKFCKLLGNISYPLYLVNYPLCYVHTAWRFDTKYTLAEGWWISALVFVAIILLAYLALKLFDEPVRKWLKKFQ